MRKEGRAEYVAEGGGEGGDVVWIYWRTPEEWASLIEGWVDETAQKGTVLTLYELTEGEGTRGTGKSLLSRFYPVKHLSTAATSMIGPSSLGYTANREPTQPEFHGLDTDLLQKALNILVKRGKAQIFGQEDSQGVKFF